MTRDQVLMKKPTGSPTPPPSLLTRPVTVINVGLERFAEELRANGVTVTHVQWSPPAGGNARLAALLSKLGS